MDQLLSLGPRFLMTNLKLAQLNDLFARSTKRYVLEQNEHV